MDCFTPGPGNEPNNLYSVCGNNYKIVQLGLTYTINTGKTKNFENIVGTYQDDTLTGDSARNIILGGAARMLSEAWLVMMYWSAALVRRGTTVIINYRYDNTLKLSQNLYLDNRSGWCS